MIGFIGERQMKEEGEDDEEEEDDVAEDEDYEYHYDSEDEVEDGITSSYTEPAVRLVSQTSFDIVIDPKEETTEEWRAIYIQVRGICNQFKFTREVQYEWDHRHKEHFREVKLSIQSKRSLYCFYSFKLYFLQKGSLVYPEIPPLLLPQFSLPPGLFIKSSSHPLLQASTWSPIRDLAEIFQTIVDELDDQLDLATLETLNTLPPIAGGDFHSTPPGKEEFFYLSPSTIPIETLIAFLYREGVDLIASKKEAAVTITNDTGKSLTTMFVQGFLVDKLDVILNEFLPSNRKQTRCFQWIYDSPLLQVLHDYITIAEDYSFFRIFIQLELLFQETNINVSEDKAEMFRHGYELLRLHYSEVSMTRGWSPHLLNKSHNWKEREDPVAVAEERWLSISTNYMPIVFVSGLEAHHAYVSHPLHTRERNEAFHSELHSTFTRFPPEVTIFIATKFPNLLLACFHVREKLSPHCGATFLFYILIPTNYPTDRAQIKLHNHSFEGREFQPDLYNQDLSSSMEFNRLEVVNRKSFSQLLQKLLVFTLTGDTSVIMYDMNPQSYEAKRRNGGIIGSMLSYGILSHLMEPFPVPEIYQYIYHYYQQHWSENLEVVVLQNINTWCRNYMSRKMEEILAEMNLISALLQK